MLHPSASTQITLRRRTFLKGGTFLLAGSVLLLGHPAGSLAADAVPRLRIGLVTDLHYANKPPVGNRCCRESLAKFAEAVQQFNADKVDLVIALGDVIDGADAAEIEKKNLDQVAQAFACLCAPHHYVLGNHCVCALTKCAFLNAVCQKRSYDSFDVGGYHIVLLDACFRSDGEPYARQNFDWTDANIPPAELEWLRNDLRQTPHKCIVCVHQCLDVPPPLGIKNAEAVRKVLEESDKVLAVLQGHRHEGNYQQIGGIHYCTLMAMTEGAGLENNAFAVLNLLPNDTIELKGLRRQKSYP
jgi:alkaline phosphatase